MSCRAGRPQVRRPASNGLPAFHGLRWPDVIGRAACLPYLLGKGAVEVPNSLCARFQWSAAAVLRRRAMHHDFDRTAQDSSIGRAPVGFGDSDCTCRVDRLRSHTDVARPARMGCP